MTRYVECPICENVRAPEGISCTHCSGIGLVPEHKLLRKIDKYEMLLKFVRKLAATPYRENSSDYDYNLLLVSAENVLKRIGEYKEVG